MRALLLVIVAVSLFSCKKNKTTYVNVPVHDTTYITSIDTTFFHASLFGNWISATNQTLKFTSDTLIWDGGYSYKYAADHDTIFHVFSHSNIIPVFTYSVTASSLYLMPVNPPFDLKTYTRD